jgi:hypothetical protein
MCRTGAINAQVRVMKPRRNFSQQTHPIHPIGPQTHILERFGSFHYCSNFGAKWGELVLLCTILWNEVASKFFATNAPDPPPLDPKLMFWGCFKPFHYCVNFGAKWVKLGQLMHKFVK